MRTIIQSFGTITSSELESFEKKFSIKLPKSYKDFLLSSNGGCPEPDTFVFEDESDGSIVDYFLGIDLQEYYYNLGYTFETFRNRIPRNFLPIACDPGGNLILIGWSQKELGKIYFWDHEFEANDCEPDMSNMHLISQDFESFLNSLHEYEDKDDA